MKRLIFVCLFAPFLLFSTGCWHFWPSKGKSKKPKETTEVVADVEATFKLRYLEKRTAELVAQGVQADAAHQQALDEFRTRYSYTGAAKK